MSKIDYSNDPRISRDDFNWRDYVAVSGDPEHTKHVEAVMDQFAQLPEFQAELIKRMDETGVPVSVGVSIAGENEGARWDNHIDINIRPNYNYEVEQTGAHQEFSLQRLVMHEFGHVFDDRSKYEEKIDRLDAIKDQIEERGITLTDKEKSVLNSLEQRIESYGDVKLHPDDMKLFKEFYEVDVLAEKYGLDEDKIQERVKEIYIIEQVNPWMETLYDEPRRVGHAGYERTHVDVTIYSGADDSVIRNANENAIRPEFNDSQVVSYSAEQMNQGAVNQLWAQYESNKVMKECGWADAGKTMGSEAEACSLQTLPNVPDEIDTSRTR